MKKEYYQPAESGKAELIINRSKFIAIVEQVRDEGSALRVLDNERKRYPDATHHCYAYIIGENGGIMRHSDDGEPSGTAGAPILEAIRAKSLTNIIVVVTRYFGGVLLGTGGLVRAYSGAAAEAVKSAGQSHMVWGCEYSVILDYPSYGRVERGICGGCNIITTEFADTVTLHIQAEQTQEDSMLRALAELSNGGAKASKLRELYIIKS